MRHKLASQCTAANCAHVIAALVLALVLAALPAPAAAQDLSQPGPFPVGTRTVTVTRPNTSTFTAELLYPATAPGAAAPFNPGAAPAPAVHFGHGFLTPVARYQSTLAHLASHGYIVIATNSAGDLFPSHSAYAQDMSLCLTYVVQQNAAPGSFLEGRVSADALGLSGHSMGGGASHLAAAADPRVRAIATLAAAETNPSAAQAAAGLAIPNLLIAGSADTITPLASHGQLMYNATRGPRQIPVILGGYHCGFLDSSIFGCDSGALPRAEQLALTRRLLVEFFDLHLKGDQSRWRRVWGPESRPPLEDPRIQRTADPRATLLPAQATATGAGGAVVEASLTLTNTGPVPAAFDLLAETEAGLDPGPWAVEFIPPVTPELPPGAAVVITARVLVPLHPAPEEEAIVLSARASSDGGTRIFSRLLVRRVCTADWNADGAVNSSDLSAFLTSWIEGVSGGEPIADVNGDNLVNSADISTFITLWLAAIASGC